MLRAHNASSSLAAKVTLERLRHGISLFAQARKSVGTIHTLSSRSQKGLGCRSKVPARFLSNLTRVSRAPAFRPRRPTHHAGERDAATMLTFRAAFRFRACLPCLIAFTLLPYSSEVLGCFKLFVGSAHQPFARAQGSKHLTVDVLLCSGKPQHLLFTTIHGRTVDPSHSALTETASR